MAKQFKKKKRNSLTIFSILLLLMLGVVIISWIIHWAMPGGFESTSGFIEYIKPAGLLDVLTSPIQGFIDAASVIVFLLLLSAFLKIVNDSRSLDAAIGQLFLKLRGKEVILIISVTLAFAVCGTTFGMCEATIPFYALLIPILLAAGFDSFTAFLVICFGAGIGVLASTVNPVLVTNSVNAINTGPAGDGSVTTSSGIVWRLISLVVLTTFVVGYILWYARRVKLDPSKSIVYDMYQVHKKKFHFNASAIPQMTKQRKWTFVVFCLTFGLLILGAIPWDTLTGSTVMHDFNNILISHLPYLVGQNPVEFGSWSLPTLSLLFLGGSLVAGIISWAGEKDFINRFVSGASEFTGVAFVCATATGFSVILKSSNIQDLIIAKCSGIGTMPGQLGIIVLFVLFFIIATLIPSMSGFARSVMPTVGGTLQGATNGITYSGSILTFSFASGIVNLIMPTAYVMVIGLDRVDSSLGKFYRRCWPIIVGIFVLIIVLLVVGVSLGGKSSDSFVIF